MINLASFSLRNSILFLLVSQLFLQNYYWKTMIAAVRLTIPRMIDAEFTALARLISPSSMDVYATPSADTGPNIKIASVLRIS